MTNEIFIGIRKIPGGFIVDTKYGQQIEKTLNKALAVAKTELSEEVVLSKDILEKYGIIDSTASAT